MIKAISRFALAFTILTVTATALPAVAADGAAPAESKPAAKPAKKSGGGGGGSNFAARSASFAVGMVFGTPIAIVRKTGQEIVQGTKDLVGDTDNWFILAPAGVVATPFGCVSGGAGGVLSGIKNAWTGSADEPFSKEAFSLGDM